MITLFGSLAVSRITSSYLLVFNVLLNYMLMSFSLSMIFELTTTMLSWIAQKTVLMALLAEQFMKQ
jgi:hypothetical protein